MRLCANVNIILNELLYGITFDFGPFVKSSTLQIIPIYAVLVLLIKLTKAESSDSIKNCDAGDLAF